jgi:hypothetical protein
MKDISVRELPSSPIPSPLLTDLEPDLTTGRKRSIRLEQLRGTTSEMAGFIEGRERLLI